MRGDASSAATASATGNSYTYANSAAYGGGGGFIYSGTGSGGAGGDANAFASSSGLGQADAYASAFGGVGTLDAVDGSALARASSNGAYGYVSCRPLPAAEPCWAWGRPRTGTSRAGRPWPRRAPRSASRHRPRPRGGSPGRRLRHRPAVERRRAGGARRQPERGSGPRPGRQRRDARPRRARRRRGEPTRSRRSRPCTARSASSSTSRQLSFTGQLLVGLLDPEFDGAGFDSLEFQILREGSTAVSETFLRRGLGARLLRRPGARPGRHRGRRQRQAWT